LHRGGLVEEDKRLLGSDIEFDVPFLTHLHQVCYTYF
jgi:hypothetical protein